MRIFYGRDKGNEIMVGGYCGSLTGYCLLVFEHLVHFTCASFLKTAFQVFCPLLILDWWSLTGLQELLYVMNTVVLSHMYVSPIFLQLATCLWMFYLWSFCCTELHICVHQVYCCSVTHKALNCSTVSFKLFHF